MIPLAPGILPYLHLALGAAIIGVAYLNFMALKATRVPGRVKRTAQATFGLSIVMILTGIPLFFSIGADWVIPLIAVSIFHVLLFVHIVNAFAIITQTAAVAIAYDMWEDHEFERETRAGEVPPPRIPVPPARSVPP
ncbi:MAG: hypothetical protein ACREDK_07595 [Thermoplasmata archaeon]